MRMVQTWLKNFDFLKGPALIAGIAGFALLTPVLVPVIGIMNWREHRRMRAVARQFKCEKCGHLLGDGSIALADRKFAEHVAELRNAAGPDARLRHRIVRSIHAVCTHCDTAYRYIDKSKTFVSSSSND